MSDKENRKSDSETYEVFKDIVAVEDLKGISIRCNGDSAGACLGSIFTWRPYRINSTPFPLVCRFWQTLFPLKQLGHL